MGFSIVFEGLKKSVSQYPAAYEAARAAQPALAPYATASELLAALKLSSPLPYEARDAITLALIAEQQKKAHPLWPAMLLAAFEPMMRRLRGRVRHADPEDIEQRVLVAFLNAAKKIAVREPPSRVASYLRRETEHAVFRSVVDEQASAESVGMEIDRIPDPKTDEMPDRGEPLAEDELAAAVAEETNGDELREMLIATIGENEPLRTFIRRTYPGISPSDARATYVRLQRQRHRILMRIRGRLGENRDLESVA